MPFTRLSFMAYRAAFKMKPCERYLKIKAYYMCSDDSYQSFEAAEKDENPILTAYELQDAKGKLHSQLAWINRLPGEFDQIHNELLQSIGQLDLESSKELQRQLKLGLKKFSEAQSKLGTFWIKTNNRRVDLLKRSNPKSNPSGSQTAIADWEKKVRREK